MDNELKWNITRVEKRERVQKAVFIIGPLLIGLIILILINRFSFKNIVISVLGVILSFLILLIVNKFFPYKERIYILNDDGLMVSKGKKIRRYLWNDFEYFHLYYMSIRESNKIDKSSRFDVYRSDIGVKRKKIFEAQKIIEGNIFYLKKKPKNIFSRFCKTFVVIYSEIDNSNTILNFLDSHLPQKKMSMKTELGLIFYEFK